MDELMPEIEWSMFSFECKNKECSSYEVSLELKAPSECKDIMCGPCGTPITDIKKIVE